MAKKTVVVPKPWHLYVIICKEKNHLYVGITQYPEKRIVQHIKGRGCPFTAYYGYKSHILAETTYESREEAEAAEVNQVLEIQRKYKKHVVAGGPWTDLDGQLLDRENLTKLQRQWYNSQTRPSGSWPLPPGSIVPRNRNELIQTLRDSLAIEKAKAKAKRGNRKHVDC